MFKSISFVKPTWYYRRLWRSKISFFVDYDFLSDDIKSKFPLDDRYKSLFSKKFDVSYRLFVSGYLKKDKDLLLSNFDFNYPIYDEFLFLKKNFHFIYYCIFFIYNFFTLNRFFSNCHSFIKLMSLKRESSLPTSFSFESKNELIQLPSVAIVIPTLNRYDYLKNTLSDLSLQDYKNFQVVVVDQSDNFNQFFYSQFKFPITVIRQPTKGLCQARNTAINSVQSDFYLLFDDDSRVNPDWISQHLISFFNFKFDISSGASPRLEEFDSKNFVNYYRYSDVLDTGNCLIPRYVFKKIGLLDLRYERQIREDSDLGFRALLNGFVILHNPRALRVHLKASTGGLRQFGSIDGFKINRVFSAKPHPSVFLYSWFYFGIKTLFYEFFISIYRFYSPFYNGNNIYARIFINTPFYVLQTPILFFQVLYSFILAVKMKFSNPLIPLLK